MRRPLLGILLIFVGAWTIFFAWFAYIVNLEDEGPRCLGGCAPSLLQYYQMVYAISTIAAIVGTVAVGLGVWFLIQKRPQSGLFSRGA